MDAVELLPSGLPKEIDDADRLARFVFSDSHVNRSGVVKKSAFMPAPGATALSATRINGLLHADMEPIAEQARGDRPSLAKGYAVLITGVVRAEGFNVVADGPPQRHAHIQHFPPDKDDQIERALSLALRVQQFCRM